MSCLDPILTMTVCVRSHRSFSFGVVLAPQRSYSQMPPSHGVLGEALLHLRRLYRRAVSRFFRNKSNAVPSESPYGMITTIGGGSAPFLPLILMCALAVATGAVLTAIPPSVANS